VTLNAVLCGCGAMSKGWLRAIKETPALAAEIEVKGLVDVNPAAAEKLAEEFGLSGAVIGTDLADVIARSKADIVFDVVIPTARFNVVSTALKAGCHVLSEKPMATSLAEGAALIDLAAETGKIHAIIQNRRFISGVRRMRRFVESGAIGELTGIHCDFFLAPHFGGFREEMENVLLLDMAIHTFDAARLSPTRSRSPSIASSAIRRAPGTSTAPRPTPRSNSPMMWSSPIAAPGVPKASAPAGKASGAWSAPREC
jgi:predicted dehydrogenase